MAVELIQGSRSLRPSNHWVDAFGAASAVAYAFLAYASHAPPVPLVSYFAVMTLSWVALLTLHASFGAEGTALSLRRIVLWAVIFRVVGLFATPILEDDFYRYLWDGRSFALTGNPYLSAPMSHFDDASIPLAFQRILDGINNPDVPTLYPPVCQLVFLIGYWIAPGELLPIKLVLVLADLATLALLIPLVPRGGLLLYAWCPLLIQETAFSAHPDTLGIFFTILAFYSASRRRPAIAASCAALAVGSKIFALLLLPFLLRRLPARYWILSAGLLALVYAPFVQPGAANESVGLFVFLADWEFNSTLFALLSVLLGPAVAKGVGAIAVGAVCAGLLWREHLARSEPPAALPRGDVVLACFFLVSPVVNPWYLLWLLPFVAARPSAWGLAALSAISLSYVHGLFIPGLAAYHHPWWIRPAQLLVVAIGSIISLSEGRSSSSRGPGQRRVSLEDHLGGAHRAASKPG